MKKENRKPIKKETYLYIISGVIAFVGLVFLILGIIGDNLPVNSALYKAQASSLPWRYIGLIIIASSILFALITLLICAKNIDRAIERDIRRKQRLNALMEGSEDEILVSNGKIVGEINKAETADDRPIDLNPVENKEESNVKIADYKNEDK